MKKYQTFFMTKKQKQPKKNLIKETQILDPVLQKVKVTMEIRGNKGLFAYFCKFKSILVDETLVS